MAAFFINRPIVAIVMSIVTLILGAVSITFLPISLFPEIVTPEIVVTANYTGADARTVEQAVATPIEQQMSGVDNMNYMYSVNANSGQMVLTVDFDLSTDPNTDQILTQMRQSQASSQLPTAVNSLGVTVQKSLAAPLMVIALYSPDGSRDALFLSNYAYINLNDPLTRVQGISNVQISGVGQYAMRLWLRPDQLARLSLTVPDVVNAVQTQNTVNSAGQIGSEPVPAGQEYTYAARAQGRLVTPEEFGDIVIREQPDGGIVRLRDVGRVEFGAQSYSTKGRLNGKPAAVISVYQLPGTNALAAARGVRRLLGQLRGRFPAGVDYVVSLDTTQAVTAGLGEMVRTLVEALGLVMAVVYLFLQSGRATLIPLLAVPVSLVGAFVCFPALGFSINTLSLFGLVLAIGLVVDDAIVVVEAVERGLAAGLGPREATRQAMGAISGPVVGVALVLAAVFVPTAFIPGLTGRLYQQFAVTIAASVLLSAFNALTLSPALCALLLRPASARGGGGWLGRAFGAFNGLFERATEAYVRLSGALLRRPGLALGLLAAFGAGAWALGRGLPAGFLPDEDQGFFYVNLQLPRGASLQRTEQACRQVEALLAQIPGIRYTTTTVGSSLLSGIQSTYSAFFFVTLDSWKNRKAQGKHYQEIKARLNRELAGFPEGSAFAFSPPPIPGAGTSGDLTFILEDRSGGDAGILVNNVKTFLAAARKRPEFSQVSTTFLPDVPQVYVDVDLEKALKQGIAVSDIYQTIQTFMGGSFINYFNRFGRQWQVYLQAEGEFRRDLDNLGQFYVRNGSNKMIPLSTVVRIERRTGPEFTMRYNLYNSAQINATPAPGYTIDQATRALESVFAQTSSPEMGYDYLGMSFQQKQAQLGIPPAAIFAFSLLFVFLILAALYESWSLPFSVLLTTPIAVFGAFAMLSLRRAFTGAVLPPFLVQIENNVFAQIGLVMIIGLVAKNAILIVEFAKVEYERGTPLLEASLTGARLRFRPIIMTSFAFIIGCVPLWTASGSGAVARQVMGTTVIGGMLAASLIAVFLIPMSFYFIETIATRKNRRRRADLFPP
ncbi:MAG: efflux RND transporter permease subunit [Verrucomicrobia bacterium]|nr:efflux RND transporter permease subunit [Verrucomicrobiota bacterium]